MLSDLSVSREPESLIGRERPVEEEAGGHGIRGFGVALDGPAAELRDQLECTPEARGRDADASVSLANEATGDAPVRQPDEALFVLGPGS